MDHDRLFKELLRTFFGDFLALFLPAVAEYVEPGSLEFLDKEVFTDLTASDRHEVDLLAKCRFRGPASDDSGGAVGGNGAEGSEAFFLVHVETQASARPDFARRMFRYFARLTERHALPVYPIALLTFDAPRRPEPDRYAVSFPDLDVLAFRFRAIQLNQMNWRDFARKPNPVAAALMAKMRIEPADRPKVTLEILRLLATLKLDMARQGLVRNFMDAYLKLSAAEMAVYYQELAAINPPERENVMQIVNYWEARGEARGSAKILLALLRARFGQVADPLAARVAALSPAAQEQMAAAAFEFASLADADAWLAAHG
jgi:hypothetical protein